MPDPLEDMSYISIHNHIIFATKNRQPLIAPVWRDRLHEYLGGIANGLGAFPDSIGGVEDHVHLLIGFKATHRISDFMCELKKASSAWVKSEIGLKGFAWQEGYSAFSVSPTARPAVGQYIRNQEAHHLKKTHKEELVELLEKAGIEFNPVYLG
ncbi:MAG: IS200/IS605 family transposase [Mariniblastus sp.]